MSGSKITINPQDDFFESLQDAPVTPLPGSVFIKNDNTLDKYINEPMPMPMFPSSTNKPISPPIFNPILSPVKEVDENDELGVYGGGSRNPKINSDENLFIVVLDLHGGYSIDNKKGPVTSITKRNAPLIEPGNKFDGYESLTICGAAPPSQINTAMPNTINLLYHPIIIVNLFKFSKALSIKLSSVYLPMPVPVSKLRNSRGASSVHSKKSIGRGGGYRTKIKKVTTPTLRPRTPVDLSPPTFASMMQVPGSIIRSGLSKFPKVVSSIQKVSRDIKKKLFSLVSGCIKIEMSDFKVNYAFLDASHEKYNILEKNIVNAIMCMSRHGVLKINDDFFNAFSYSLFCGLRQHDEGYFSKFCEYAVSVAEPNSVSCITRKHALANAGKRFPCIRSIIQGGAYNANHVEKIYQYDSNMDVHSGKDVRIYRYAMVSSIDDKGEIYITPQINFIDVDISEIFDTTATKKRYYEISLSDLSLKISKIIDKIFFGGGIVKKHVSILDLSCSGFEEPQIEVPFISHDVGLGGTMKVSRKNMTTCKNKRKERKERSNSKIRNRRLSRRTRKNKNRRS